MEKSLTGLRGRTKAVIGVGCFWGVVAFAVTLPGAFTIGVNDSAPEIVALLLYGFTMLPACILAIWFLRYSAVWWIGLFPMTAFGLIYQMASASGDHGTLVRGIAASLVLALIPGLVGALLLLSEHRPVMDEDAAEFLSRGCGAALNARLRFSPERKSGSLKTARKSRRGFRKDGRTRREAIWLTAKRCAPRCREGERRSAFDLVLRCR
jgi:hypothetical protein